MNPVNRLNPVASASPALTALADSVREIEHHVADAGWDGPVRVFALVRTQAMLPTEPGLAAQLDPAVLAAARAEPWHLTSVEQEELPAAPDLETLLGGPLVAGDGRRDGRHGRARRAAARRRGGHAAGHRRGPGLPARRTPSARTCGSSSARCATDPSWCAVRTRANDTDEQVGQGPDLVPGLVAAVRSTLE